MVGWLICRHSHLNLKMDQGVNYVIQDCSLDWTMDCLRPEIIVATILTQLCILNSINNRTYNNVIVIYECEVGAVFD